MSAGSRSSGFGREHGVMRNAGVDPDIDRVGAMASSFRQSELARERRVIQFKPDVRAALLNNVRQFADPLRIENRFAGRRIESRQRHAPAPLARDHPVGPRFYGARNPVLAPGRNPVHGFDRCQRIAPEGVDANEELFDCAKDDRRLRAPAIRIRMLVNLFARATFLSLGAARRRRDSRRKHICPSGAGKPASSVNFPWSSTGERIWSPLGPA